MSIAAVLALFCIGFVLWLAWALTYNVHSLEMKIDALHKKIDHDREEIKFLHQHVHEHLEDRLSGLERIAR